MSYLSSKNPEGLSIENISFEELRLVLFFYFILICFVFNKIVINYK